MLPPAGNAVIFRVGQGVKRLGEAVTALAQGLSLCGNGEIQPPGRVVVDAVLLQKVDAALAGRKPFVLHAVQMAQIGENPAAAPLHPDALVGGKNLALPVQAGIDSAVDRVHPRAPARTSRCAPALPGPIPGSAAVLSDPS